MSKPGRVHATADGTADSGAGSHPVRLECKGNGTLPGLWIFLPSLTTIQLG